MTTRTLGSISSSTPAFRGLVGRVFSMLSLYRERQSLARLDDKMLADIGVTREQALREAGRPLWDNPIR
ncbi:DUF1127 domain-containing protein [Pseudooceanicola aestuarii]|uniref:DUF1127 domain-containing protein n=1 Tax=Pseudooceanicola aestuarii TaxID=2697319 RepID=UPI0013CF98FC|nr:DUF1127 domain-containing protein [Pseudooceanicola aestuarii]